MKILIVDDHALFSAGLRMLLLPLQAEMQVFECANARGALAHLAQHADTRLCLLDLSLRHEDGMQAISSLKRVLPAIAVVVVSADESPVRIHRALDAGAMGYIPKSVTPEIMTHALKLVLAGGVYLPQSLLELDPQAAAIDMRTALNLTARQVQVLQCLVQGLPNKLISDRLNLSDNTVKSHLSAIYRALEVTTRSQAMVIASRLGIHAELLEDDAG